MSNTTNWFTFDRDLMSTPRVRLALFALVVSALLLVFAVMRAVRIEQTVPEGSVLAARAGKQLPVARVVQIDPEQVVERDIFAYDRTAPAGRYPMPGEFADDPAPVASSGPPPARPQVLGTAIGLDGYAFATAQLPNMSPRIVRVGDKLGIYTVVGITRGTVTFRAADALTFAINAP